MRAIPLIFKYVIKIVNYDLKLPERELQDSFLLCFYKIINTLLNIHSLINSTGAECGSQGSYASSFFPPVEGLSSNVTHAETNS